MHLYLLSTIHLPRSTLPQARPSVPCDDAGTQRRTEDILPRLPLASHVKSITSPSNPFVKHCLKLRQSSTYRHFHGSAIVVGTTPIREIYRFQDSIQGATTMDCLLLLDGAEVPKELYNSPVRIVYVSPMVMKKLSGVQSIDSIKAAALMRIPPSFRDMDDKQREANCRTWFPFPHRILVLDGIQDPGNLGTLLRSAMAFRWDGVFLLPGCCDPFNDKVLRAARGASFQLPIVSGNWGHLKTLAIEFKMKLLAGHPEISTELKSSSLLSQKLANSLADNHMCLVLGSEGHGLSDQSKQVCELVSIPMAGKFESLNVSVAGMVRQRLQDLNEITPHGQWFKWKPLTIRAGNQLAFNKEKLSAVKFKTNDTAIVESLKETVQNLGVVLSRLILDGQQDIEGLVSK